MPGLGIEAFLHPCVIWPLVNARRQDNALTQAENLLHLTVLVVNRNLKNGSHKQA